MTSNNHLFSVDIPARHFLFPMRIASLAVLRSGERYSLQQFKVRVAPHLGVSDQNSDPTSQTAHLVSTLLSLALAPGVVSFL